MAEDFWTISYTSSCESLKVISEPGRNSFCFWDDIEAPRMEVAIQGCVPEHTATSPGVEERT